MGISSSARQPEEGHAPSPSPISSPAGGGGGGSSASSGAATLNINSIPVSNIILDGRPVGPTPKVGVRVSAGLHTVVFFKGTDRKNVSVTVSAGQTRTVAVRF
jgi:serine/threonine-protein kinase